MGRTGAAIRVAAHELLDQVVAEYRPKAVIGMFSGGHDSLMACHLAASHRAFTHIAHINTGIGIEATRAFVRETCTRLSWPLREYHPPVRYRDIVLEHGFPGPAGHTHMYRRLKERCVRALAREHRTVPGDRIVMVTGARKAESTRRMGYVESVTVIDGTQVWAAIIADVTHAEKHAYFAEHDLPRNAVVDVLCMSGECLCGAFARPGELEEIRLWYPTAAEQIDRLQDEARRAGGDVVDDATGGRGVGEGVVMSRRCFT